MHVITKRRLVEFAEKHSDAQQPLLDWFRIMKKMTFTSPNGVKEVFGSADFLGGGLTVFNVGANKYRISASMRYDLRRVYIRRVMTHAEYVRRSREGTL